LSATASVIYKVDQVYNKRKWKNSLWWSYFSDRLAIRL
jgi:hypothetical protein